jgi:gliding motility-associated-like protein
MNLIQLSFIRITLVSAFAMSFIQCAWGQKPAIKSVDRFKGPMEDVVTVKGSFFGADKNKLAVTFGASKAEILTLTDQIMELKVPFGTTYHNLGITNLTNGLTGYTQKPFLLSFSGKPGFELANLQGQFNFPAGTPSSEGLNDLCMCDFDGDKKVDVATANNNFKYVNVYPNNSSPGTVAFPSKTAVNIAALSLHIRCGDLNGDGKPDLVVSESGTSDRIFILKNGSTGVGNFAFLSPVPITLSGKRPKRIEIADLDLDGKPELIVTAQTSNTVTVLVNQSTLASILFSPSPPIHITIPGAASTEGLAVADANGDGLPEIITSQYQINSDIYIIENKSSPGSFQAGVVSSLPVNTIIKNIRVGDLDGDEKPDIAFTQINNSSIGVFLNQSTGTITFDGLKTFATDVTPCGIDFGDLDGDGRPDIGIASTTKKSITILNNISTSGNLAFDKLIQPTTFINRHVNIADVDTDGKPDIAFTSIDDNNLNIPASKVSIFRNKTCMIPKVTPEGPLNVCAGFTLRLKATKGGGVTYEWTNLTTGTVVTGTHEFTPTVSGDYVVKAISEGSTCSETSNTVKTTISPGVAADPLPVNDGPTCIGNTLTLSISNDLGAGFTYEWTGPNNYTGTGVAPPPIANFSSLHAGRYYVNVKAASGCVARTESTLVEAVDLPEFKVSFAGGDVICAGDLKQLFVSPIAPGFTYQWYKKSTGLIAGATSTSYTIAASGEFYYTATSTNPNCSVVNSKSATFAVVTLPVVAFTAPSSVCKGQEISFVNQTSFDAQAAATFMWDFGDATVSTDKNPTHIYQNTGSFPVKLTVSYNGNACPVSVTNPPIVITDAPAVSITTDLNKFEICAEEKLVLLLAGSFTNYAWSTGATTPQLEIEESGDYSVSVTAANGCKLKATTTISRLPDPLVSISATPEIIEEGQSAQLLASGLESYSWTPAETLSSSTIENPVAMPLTSTTYTVTGKDNNNCKGKATVDVRVKGEAIVKKLKPSNFFSPDQEDAVNPYWMVEKIDEYPQCAVTIYDDKGVKVFDAKPYMNDWDGTFNGKRLPDGVYYYIIRCEGEESLPRSGSITVLR